MTERVQTVLVVDDDPFVLALIRQVLASTHRVLTLTDPRRALPTIEWEGVDLLVSDIAMPEVSGLELVARARQIFPLVPRVLLTSERDFSAAVKAINEGEVFRFLTKPLDAEGLLRTVREGLERGEALRRAAAIEQAETRRREALTALEREYPGLCRTDLHGGFYVIATERLEELAQLFHSLDLEAP